LAGFCGWFATLFDFGIDCQGKREVDIRSSGFGPALAVGNPWKFFFVFAFPLARRGELSQNPTARSPPAQLNNQREGKTVTRSSLLYRTALLAALLFVDIASVLHAQTKYFVTDLETPGGAEGANAVNARGQVVGVGVDVYHAFRTAPNRPINPATDDLGTLGGGQSLGFAINIWGQVAGESGFTGTGIGGDTPLHAFRTAPNRPIDPATDDLGTLGGIFSAATSINVWGQVVGWADVLNAGIHAFRTVPNRPIDPATDDLGTLGNTDSYANGINDWGQVVGSSFNASLEEHAFRTAPNRPINAATDDLGTLGGMTSYGIAINNWGQVVGSSSFNASLEQHAFRTAPNRPINAATDDLGTLGGMASGGIAINDWGQVVGNSSTTSDGTVVHAFLFSGRMMYDLNNLIPADFGWELESAGGINDAGQIVGNGIHNGRESPFLLTPANKALCNNSGWKNYGFGNQEQCLQFAKTDR
jgi:probable HAF family extracellular repeat protein